MQTGLFFAILLGYFILINGVLALGLRLLPKSWFGAGKALYRPRAFEKAFYARLKLRRWKDKLPQAGWMQGFSMKKLPGRPAREHVRRLLLESCYAEVGHSLSALLGFGAVILAALLPVEGRVAATIALSLFATLHAVVHLVYVVIQRYNRPRYERLLKNWDK